MPVVTPASQPDIPPVPVWRVTVERYHEMIRAGVLTAADRLELLDGWLVPKMPQNPPHRGVVFRVRETLRQVLPDRWYVDGQVPITLAASEPEPDVVVVRGKSEQYLERHPGPRELGLVVEVADTSLVQDRLLKKAIYAEADIPLYWIVNLAERRVEVFGDPSGPIKQPNYGRRRDYGPGEEVPLILDGREICRIPVAGFFP